MNLLARGGFAKATADERLRLRGQKCRLVDRLGLMPMAEQPMFRAAALDANKSQWLGGIVLVRPLSLRLLTVVAVACALLICVFFIWGSYTKRSTLIGQLVPDSGLIKVYVPQLGIVQEKRVAEGQRVHAGDVLYVLSSDRQSQTQGSIQASISQQISARRALLRDELEKTRHQHSDEREALELRIGNTAAELEKLDGLLQSQRARVQLSEDSRSRYAGLLRQDYISREQLQQKEEDLLDQRSRLQGLERERIGVVRSLASLREDLRALAFKHQSLLSQIERSISSVEQELTESEAKRLLTILAPHAGIATALIAEVGQAVDGSRPLLSIVPEGAKLQAHLYAPSRAVGFIRPGETVMLRYQAYPYQKFGHARGTVFAVAKTALPAKEISALGTVADANGGGNEPIYLVSVELGSQQITAYGQVHDLQAGMLLEADVLQDRRRLYEWVLEPLFSVTGKL